MLRLLLDEHISPSVASEARRHRPDCEIAALRDWQGGAYFHERDDGQILERALEAGFTLVTRDESTITPLLATWEAEGRIHGGVIFVDRRTITERDVGGLVRAVIQLWDQQRDEDWQRRVVYLRRSQ